MGGVPGGGGGESAVPQPLPAERQAVGLLSGKSPSTTKEQASTQMAPFCRSCTQRNWQQELTSPGPQLQMVIRQRKEPLFTYGQCQAYILLQQGAPQERPGALIHTQPNPDYWEIFQVTREHLQSCTAAQSLLRHGFTQIGSDREARPGQRWVW